MWLVSLKEEVRDRTQGGEWMPREDIDTSGEDTMWWWRQRLDWCFCKPRNAKDRWPPPGAKNVSVESQKEYGPAAPWFQTFGSRTVRWLISVVLSHAVCGILLGNKLDWSPILWCHPFLACASPSHSSHCLVTETFTSQLLPSLPHILWSTNSLVKTKSSRLVSCISVRI